MRKRPLLAVGLFAFLTALAATRVSMLAVTLFAVTAVCVLIGAVLFRSKRQAKAVGFAAVGVMLVSLSFLAKTCFVILPQRTYDGARVNVTMQVMETTNYRDTYLVRVVSGEMEQDVRLILPLVNDNIAPKAGDLLSGEVVLSVREDAYAKANGANLRANADELLWTDGSNLLSKPTAMLYEWREYIHDLWYRHMGFDSAAVSDAITIGNRSLLDDNVAYTFRVSGIYHLLCVSGMHLSVLVGVMLFVFRRVCHLRTRLAALLTMAGAVAFAALCGFTVSVNRAVVMSLIVLASMLFRRRADGLNSLGFAAGVMLMFDPFAIYDLGFLLTFSSTLGILLLLPAWEKSVTRRATQRVPRASALVRPLVTAVGVSVSATLFVQPILSLYFGTFSTYFLLGNVLCGAASTLLLVLCMSGVVLSLVIPSAAHAVLTVCDAICRWMIACAEVIASLSFATLSSDMTLLLVWQWLLPLAVFVVYRCRRVRVTAVVAVVMTVLLAIGIVPHALSARRSMTVRTVSADDTAVVVRTPDGIGVIFEGSGEGLSESVRAVREMGRERIDWMIWLEHGGARCVDLSGMVLPVSKLMTVDAPDTYVSLPHADTVTALSSECVISVGKDCDIERIKGWFVLSYRDTTIAIADEFSDAEDLIPYEADAVLLSEYLPYHAESLDATCAVVFCRYAYREYWETSFPAPFYYASQVKELTTKGNGEFDLRLE